MFILPISTSIVPGLSAHLMRICFMLNTENQVAGFVAQRKYCATENTGWINAY